MFITICSFDTTSRLTLVRTAAQYTLVVRSIPHKFYESVPVIRSSSVQLRSIKVTL